uniref:peptidylprolyl isomerase n=1 Tax=Mus spicilegus TaxID=10103 RepID=A0A8C6GVX9_MUSSI
MAPLTSLRKGCLSLIGHFTNHPGMPPKGKSGSGEGGEGGAASGSDSADKKSQGPKCGGNAVKVRHILCEKHGKVMEAMEKLKSGMRCNEVTTQYSEDKVRQGVLNCCNYHKITTNTVTGSLASRVTA